MFEHTRTINLCDVELQVSFDYEHYIPHDNFEPGRPQWIDVGPVMAGGVDIYNLLSDEQLQRIERMISDAMVAA